ncbi:MAG: hypothetical protein JNM94_16835 [Phycisphaerae bacterium]|nr:hypothetical protein [Phycisphaerae bacterium]
MESGGAALAVICTVIAALAGCNPPAGKEAFAAAVHEWVPTGTGADDAIATMIAKGFGVDRTMTKNAAGVEADSLYCDRRAAEFLVMTREWRAIFWLTDGRVSETSTDTFVTGP